MEYVWNEEIWEVGTGVSKRVNKRVSECEWVYEWRSKSDDDNDGFFIKPQTPCDIRFTVF